MKTTTEQIKLMKGRERISVLTAYDFPSALAMDGLVDIILVGDSLGMAVYGEKNTLNVTMQDMIRHTKAVAMAAKKSLIVGDMPAGSYGNAEMAIRNAGMLIDAGADAVKIEKEHEIAAELVKNSFSVMGHVGLTPQTITDFRVQGKDEDTADKITNEAKKLEKAGCFSIVLECMPSGLAKGITQGLKIPTIGIGAGKLCDGQVLVVNDMLGMNENFKPKFVKRYAKIAEEMRKAFMQYNKDVKEGKFPAEEHSFHQK